MTLDIVIPTYNEATNLSFLLPYLRQHSIKENTRIIVVDSAKSTDNIASLCQEYNVLYHKSEITQRAVQLNTGARLGQNKLILFLHADVLPPTNFVSNIQDVINAGSKAGFFAYRFKSKHLLLKINAYFTQYDGILTGGGDQCQFMLRSVFESCNGYDESYDIMEDFDLIKRIKAAGISYHIIKNPAQVSARKYDQFSYFRVNIVNLISMIKFRRGDSPSSIKSFYDRWLKQ